MSEILATSDEIHDIEKRIEDTGFYNPKLWPRKYVGRFITCTKYELSDEEYSMVREIAHKAGYPMRDVIHMAIADYYRCVMIR